MLSFSRDDMERTDLSVIFLPAVVLSLFFGEESGSGNDVWANASRARSASRIAIG
jgi:hypothetical protein